MLGSPFTINCYVLCVNINADTVRDTKYEYMYVLKYPEKTPPENAEAYYVESLSKTAFDYPLDISVIGVDDDEKYYGVSPEKGKSKITASTSAAQKYGLKKGDKLILTDSATDMDYAFTLTVFCVLVQSRTLFLFVIKYLSAVKNPPNKRTKSAKPLVK